MNYKISFFSVVKAIYCREAEMNVHKWNRQSASETPISFETTIKKNWRRDGVDYEEKWFPIQTNFISIENDFD